jgi:hypothetical protein
LLLRLVFRVEQSLGCRLISSFQAFAFASVPVEQVEHAALAAIDTVSWLHDFFHERNDPAFRIRPLLCTGCVRLDSSGVLPEY